MSRVLTSALIMIGLSAVSTFLALSANSVDGVPRPADRMVNLGFEDIVNVDPGHLAGLAGHLDSVHATAVSIAVGRTDWTAFPSSSGSAASTTPESTGRDFVAEAIAAVGTSGNGIKRDIILTIDVLLDRALREDPSLAGRNMAGKASGSFASVSALRHGAAGSRLVALASEVAERYHPLAVDLTELMFDDFVFGADDLKDFKATTGLQDWPRLSNGSIDASDPHLRTWRCEAVADIARQVSAAVEPFGVRTEMDVRSPKTSASDDRADSGHDYDLLLKQVSRLHVWQYVGLNDERAPVTEALVRALNERAGSRMSTSLGLWAKDGTISAKTLGDALREAAKGGATSISVTPASLMSDEHWEVLRKAWAE